MSFLLGFLGTLLAFRGVTMLRRLLRKRPAPEYVHSEPHSAIAIPSLDVARRTIEAGVCLKALPGTTLIVVFDTPGPYGEQVAEILITLDP